MATRSERVAASASPVADGRMFDLNELLRMLFRRRWVIGGTVAAVLLGLMLYLLRTEPLYTAETILRVRTEAPSTEATPGSMRSAIDEQLMATHLELLRAPAVGEQVVRDLDLQDDPEFQPRDLDTELPGDKDEAAAIRLAKVVENLFEHVEVTRAAGSSLIRVAVTTTDPEKSARIANTLAGTHRKNLLKERRSATERDIEYTSARADELRSEALQGEQAAVARGKKAGIPSASGGDAGASVATLASHLAEARAQRAAAETRLAQGTPGATGSGAGAGGTPLLTDLRAQLAAVDARIAELSARFGPGHPELIAASAQRSDIADRLAEESVRARQGAAAEVAAARARERQIEADLAAARAREMKASDVSVDISDLQNRAATNRELYLQQLSRLQELRGREQNLSPEASVVAKALVPVSASHPKRGRILVSGLAGGLLLGLLLAFTVESLDSRIRTSAQVRRLLGLDTLAMIPEVPELRLGQSPLRYLSDEPASHFAETIRALAIDLFGKARRSGRSILITSPLPREGKTLVATSLGAASAALGNKTIIVDLDLRRPGVNRMLGLDHEGKEVIDCFAGTGHATSDEVLAAVHEVPEQPCLSVLSSALSPANPGVLIASPRISDILTILRQRFDLVIVNAPPLLPVHDARHLGRHADVTLLVLRWGKTSPDAALEAQRLLGKRATTAVINRVDLKRHSGGLHGDGLQYHTSYSDYFGGKASPPAKPVPEPAAPI